MEDCKATFEGTDFFGRHILATRGISGSFMLVRGGRTVVDDGCELGRFLVDAYKARESAAIAAKDAKC